MQGTATVYAACFVNTGGKGHTVASFHQTRKAAKKVAHAPWAFVRSCRVVLHPDGSAEALPGEQPQGRAPYRG